MARNTRLTSLDNRRGLWYLRIGNLGQGGSSRDETKVERKVLSGKVCGSVCHGNHLGVVQQGVSAGTAEAAGNLPRITVSTNVNVSRTSGNQAEQTVAVNPTNPHNIVVISNDPSPGPGLFESITFDGGTTWTTRGSRQGPTSWELRAVIRRSHSTISETCSLRTCCRRYQMGYRSRCPLMADGTSPPSDWSPRKVQGILIRRRVQIVGVSPTSRASRQVLAACGSPSQPEAVRLSRQVQSHGPRWCVDVQSNRGDPGPRRTR